MRSAAGTAATALLLCCLCLAGFGLRSAPASAQVTCELRDGAQRLFEARSGACVPPRKNHETGTIMMQPLLDPDGNGRLFVNDNGGPWRWEECSADLSDCSPFGWGREIETDGAAPLTVFRVSGEGKKGRSPLWRGRLDVRSAPGVRGAVRANELVRPTEADWVGGWEGDYSITQLSACEHRTSGPCTTLTDFKFIGSCRDGAAVIDPYFTGDWLRVADQRFGPGTLFTLEGHLSPYSDYIWRKNGATAVAVVGRIAKARGRRTNDCGARPVLEGHITARGEARIRCMFGCRALLVVRRGDRARRAGTIVGRRSIRGTYWARRLALPTRALERLGYGRASVTLRINGRRVDTRAVRLR